MLVRIHPLKLYILFLFQVLWDLPSLWLYSMCVCVCGYVCTHMCNSLFSLQYFSTQWQPIQIQLKQHRGLHSIIHSSVTHSLPHLSHSFSCCLWMTGWLLDGCALTITSSFYLSVFSSYTSCRKLTPQGKYVLLGMMSKCLFDYKRMCYTLHSCKKI